MPNRLYNKQVSPKGYKTGGKVKKKKDIRDKRAAKSQKKTYDAITGSLNKATLGLTNPKKFKIIDKLNIFKKKK